MKTNFARRLSQPPFRENTFRRSGTTYRRRVSGMVDGTSHAQNDTKLIQHRRRAPSSGQRGRRRLAMQPRERSQRPESDVGDRAWFVPREEGLDPFEGGSREMEGVEVAVVGGGRDNIGMAGRAVAESVLRRFVSSESYKRFEFQKAGAYLSVEILCGFAFDGTFAAEVDFDGPCAVPFPPLGVNVGVPLLDLLFGTEFDLVLECVKELFEVVGGGREGAVAVGEGDGDDDEVGRREREEDGEDVVDAGVRVAARECGLCVSSRVDRR
jgi:hypothetical protein